MAVVGRSFYGFYLAFCGMKFDLALRLLNLLHECRRFACNQKDCGDFVWLKFRNDALGNLGLYLVHPFVNAVLVEVMAGDLYWESSGRWIWRFWRDDWKWGSSCRGRFWGWREKLCGSFEVIGQVHL